MKIKKNEYEFLTSVIDLCTLLEQGTIRPFSEIDRSDYESIKKEAQARLEIVKKMPISKLSNSTQGGEQ